MRLAITVDNLRSFELPWRRRSVLAVLLRWEAWLDARRTRRALYALDERALADIGLTSADLGSGGSTTSWHPHLFDRPAPLPHNPRGR
jgi:uncharacterized protein YjiS (DUF1127 family)